ADRAGARAVSAHPHLHLVGVAMHDRHGIDRQAEAGIDELREGRLMTLPVAVRAGQHLDRADRVDAHLSRFPESDARAKAAYRRRRRDAAGLDVAGDADAAQLAALLRFLPARGEPGMVRSLQRRVE